MIERTGQVRNKSAKTPARGSSTTTRDKVTLSRFVACARQATRLR
jgi:hypothetical protein